MGKTTDEDLGVWNDGAFIDLRRKRKEVKKAVEAAWVGSGVVMIMRRVDDLAWTPSD